jgi:hypothetical protein
MAASGRPLPNAQSALFDIECAKPGDEHAAVQFEDLGRRADQVPTLSIAE